MKGTHIFYKKKFSKPDMYSYEPTPAPSFKKNQTFILKFPKVTCIYLLIGQPVASDTHVINRLPGLTAARANVTSGNQLMLGLAK